MRIAVLILAILGAIGAGILGVIWVSDYESGKDLVNLAGALGGEEAVDVDEFHRLGIAAYMLLVAALLGVVGGILAFLGKGKIAGAIMLVGVAIPGFLAPMSLVFSGLLALAGVLAFLIKPKETAQAEISETPTATA